MFFRPSLTRRAMLKLENENRQLRRTIAHLTARIADLEDWIAEAADAANVLNELIRKLPAPPPRSEKDDSGRSDACMSSKRLHPQVPSSPGTRWLFFDEKLSVPKGTEEE